MFFLKKLIIRRKSPCSQQRAETPLWLSVGACFVFVLKSMDAGAGGVGDCYGALCELVSQCDRLSTELRRHQRSASDADSRKSEWRSVALVLDRLLFVTFFVVTCAACCFIFSSVVVTPAALL